MIVLDLGHPPTDPLSINAERGMNWQKRRRLTHPWRDAAWALALEAKLAKRVAGRPCTITVVLPFAEHRRRDPHNYAPTVKAVIDGLVMAKVWPDDTPEYVTVADPVLRIGGKAEVHLVVREEQPAATIPDAWASIVGEINLYMPDPDIDPTVELDGEYE